MLFMYDLRDLYHLLFWILYRERRGLSVIIELWRRTQLLFHGFLLLKAFEVLLAQYLAQFEHQVRTFLL